MSGNTQGVARLVEGMDVDEVIRRLDGIRCGFRPTSCPDQLANALKGYEEGGKSGVLAGPETRIEREGASAWGSFGGWVGECEVKISQSRCRRLWG